MPKEKLIFSIIFISLLIRLLLIAWPIKTWLLADYNYESFQKAYSHSQYTTENSQGLIPDDTVYDYAAGFYLRGGNPILVNPEQPPLGKYLLSLSLLIFRNTRVAIHLFFYLGFFALFLLAKLILKKASLAMIVPLAFSFEEIILNQLVYTPLLDIFQLCFIILSFYFFIQWIENEKRSLLILASMSLGAAAAVKFFITALVVFVSWVIFLALKRKWLQIFRMTFWSGLSTYLILNLSYLRTLLEEPNLFKVLAIQKWIFLYHQSKLTSIGTIWPLIFANRWQTWWGDYSIIQDPQWWLGFPILFAFSFFTTLFYFVKRRRWRNQEFEVILIWFLIYSAFISLAQASLRYIIPILPFLYLVFLKGLILVWHEITKPKV